MLTTLIVVIISQYTQVSNRCTLETNIMYANYNLNKKMNE